MALAPPSDVDLAHPPADPADLPVPASSRTAWIGLGAGLALMVAAVSVPTLFDWEVFSRANPQNYPTSIDPLHSRFEPRWFGPGTIPAVLVALLTWRYAADVAARLPWRRLLLASYVVGAAWLFALALVDGQDGVAGPLEHAYEYTPTAREIDDVPAFLDGFVDRIPLDSTDNWPVHVAGHPPGATLFFVLLVRLGLGGPLAVGVVVTLLAAAAAPGVLSTLRSLGAEQVARTAAPLLVLTPAAVYQAVSADALFSAVAAWGMAALAASAVAATRRRMLALAVVAGLVLGSCVMLSYGLPLMGVLALAVLAAARSWRPLPVAVVAALVPVFAFAVAGFSWWEAYPVLGERYWDGIASSRPAAYWTWGNLASVLFSGGPLLGASTAALVAGVVGVRRRTSGGAGGSGGSGGLDSTGATGATGPTGATRTVLLLAGAGAVMILVADASQMSRAEVERIWLPFFPWLTIAVVLLPAAWRRWGLALQLATALLVEHLLFTSW